MGIISVRTAGSVIVVSHENEIISMLLKAFRNHRVHCKIVLKLTALTCARKIRSIYFEIDRGHVYTRGSLKFIPASNFTPQLINIAVFYAQRVLF